MICPVCNMTISDKRKKQIKHMHGHSSRELALEILWLNGRVRFYQDVLRDRDEDIARAIFPDPVEQPATLALDDPAGLCPIPGDPDSVFSLVEEDSEEDSDQAMAAAGMQQCAHCGLWVWPGDMAYHLDITCPELYRGAVEPVEQAAPVEDHIKCAYCGMPVAPENYDKHGYNCPLAPPHDDPYMAPGDNTTAAAPVEERGDYATVEYIRIPVDGAEYMLLNALALYIHRTNGNG